MMDFTAVFTFPERYRYALENVRAAEKCLPDNCNIIVQYEGENLPDNTDKITYVPFDLTEVREFQEKSKDILATKVQRRRSNKKSENMSYTKSDMWLWDAHRFCYKVYAIMNSLPLSNRYLCYIDSDVIFQKKVPEDFLYTLFEEDKFASYVNRETGSYLFPDTGYIGFDTHHSHNDEFWKEMRSLYNDLKLFDIKTGWTDCHAFLHCIEHLESMGVESTKLLPPKMKLSWNSWKNVPLSKYCTHHKGDYFHKPSE